MRGEKPRHNWKRTASDRYTLLLNGIDLVVVKLDHKKWQAYVNGRPILAHAVNYLKTAQSRAEKYREGVSVG